MKNTLNTWLLVGITSILVAFALVTAYQNVFVVKEEQIYSGSKLTVYNQGLGLVKQDFQASLPAGTSELLYEGVASNIDTSSVKLSGDVTLLEQNYQYDLVNKDQMMKKFIGKDITVMLNDPREELRGKLLSYSGSQAIIQDKDGKVKILSASDFILPAVNESELLLKPTLQWLVDAPKEGSYELSMMYLTRGISWNADYILELNPDDTLGELKGWVTLNNDAGTTFRDAELKLIAGDINVESPQRRYVEDVMYSKNMDESSQGGFAEESMFEYHMYTLGRSTTIKDKEQKQISLLEAEEVGIEKRFTFQGSDVQVRVIFENREEENMGIPLPAGKVKVFKADSSEALQFLGEDRIDHTPKNEEIELVIGNAFDITAEKKQTDKREGHNWASMSYEVLVKNHKDESIELYVYEKPYSWNEWEITAESHEHVKESQNEVYWKVPVGAESNKTLSYTFRYTDY